MVVKEGFHVPLVLVPKYGDSITTTTVVVVKCIGVPLLVTKAIRISLFLMAAVVGEAQHQQVEVGGFETKIS